MNKITVEALFKEGLAKYLNDDSLSDIGFVAYFDYSLNGSWSGGAGAVKNGVEIGIASPDDATDALDEFFLQVKDTPDQFNRFVFELYTDGTYKAEYLWDEELIKQDRFQTFIITPQWLNDKMLLVLHELGYGENWRNGIFRFKIQDEEIKFSGYVEENGVRKNITEDIMQELAYCQAKETLLENYQLTNFGELKEMWGTPWNLLIIHSPCNDLDLKKDVEYIWEE